MTPTDVVTIEAWTARREALPVTEKELARARDPLAAERRRPIASYPEDGCSGRTMFADNVPKLVHRRTDEYTTDELAGGTH
jgi:hypothetical protein